MVKAPTNTLPTERRHTVSIWLILLGVLAFLAGCFLLFIEDGSGVRRSQPVDRPRSQAPVTGGSFAAVTPIVPRAATVNLASSATFKQEFLDSIWRDADAAGVGRATFDRAFAEARAPDATVLALSAAQPEFDRTTGDYVTSIVTAARIAEGRAQLDQRASTVVDIERRYGVDRHILLAVWGVESNFGAAIGNRNVIRSLATLAYGDPRRAAGWRAELIAALKVLDQEKITARDLTGSWAGAMGHTQLMPSSFLKNAVDYSGTGRRDVWTSVPDALAASARFLQSAGWRNDRAWGREVILPADFDFMLTANTMTKTVTAWRALGLRAATGALPADDGTSWRVIVPAGAGGPAFLVSPNFDALLSYNPAIPYAVAVAVLADRIAGGGVLQASWPVSDVALSRDQRTELQEQLNALGYDAGAIDGIIGVKTQEALRLFQKARGLPADGHPNPAMLARLRAGQRL